MSPPFARVEITPEQAISVVQRFFRSAEVRSLLGVCTITRMDDYDGSSLYLLYRIASPFQRHGQIGVDIRTSGGSATLEAVVNINLPATNVEVKQSRDVEQLLRVLTTIGHRIDSIFTQYTIKISGD